MHFACQAQPPKNGFEGPQNTDSQPNKKIGSSMINKQATAKDSVHDNIKSLFLKNHTLRKRLFTFGVFLFDKIILSKICSICNHAISKCSYNINWYFDL